MNKKRIFSDIDDYLLAEVAEKCCQTPVKALLDRISIIETSIDTQLNHIRRIDYADNLNPSIHTKVLRNFIRHEYHSPSNEQGYFILFIEGHVLDRNLIQMRKDDELPNDLRYGSFWEKIRVHVDRKGIGAHSHVPGLMYDWNCHDKSHGGMLADCFRFRIPNIWMNKSASSSEKQIPVKVIYHRSNDVLPRFELSPLLKNIFPMMRIDVTEADIMTAVWEYIRINNLLERRYVRSNEELRSIFGTDALPINQLRAKIMEHLFPSKPIEVEYILTLSSSNIPAIGARHTPSAYSKYDAKAFDIEVDIEDYITPHHVKKINTLFKHEALVQQELDRKYNQCLYIMKIIRRKAHHYLSSQQDDKDKDLSSMLLSYPESLITQEDPVLALYHRETVSYGMDGDSVSETRRMIKQQVQREWQLLRDGPIPVHDSFRQPLLTTFHSAAEMKDDSTSPSDMSSSSVAAGGGKVAISSVAVEEKQMDDILMQWSVIHNARGFLDVGDDRLFNSSWVKETAKQLLQR